MWSWKVLFTGLLVLSVALLIVTYYKLSISRLRTPLRASTPILLLHWETPSNASIKNPANNQTGFSSSLLSSPFPSLVRVTSPVKMTTPQNVSITRAVSLSARGTTKTTPTLLPSTVQKPSVHPKVICITMRGRLGNQLFQYAAVLSLARRFNRFPVFFRGSRVIPTLQHPSPAPTAEQAQRCSKAPFQMEQACCAFDKNFLTLDPGKDYRVGKYLQSWKYFEGMEAEVRQALVFKDSVVREANATVEGLRKRVNRTLIGVHVRRGDYAAPHMIKSGYRMAPPDYYHKAMNYMRQRFGNVTFVVSVDNKTWFSQYVTSASDVTMITRHKKPVVDMVVLSSLDHVITSVGTFSWWVGYLNKGVTVYYRDFIVPGTFIGNTYRNGSTFTYPGWIPL